MHSFLLRTLVFLTPFMSTAQIRTGDIAPDFTQQDLNGNTWNLYEVLDSGKHVILDIMATWCSPCWDYHNEHLLNDIYTIYGPEGTDQLRVFMIEGDDETNISCLYDLPDCDFSTKGDWTAGTLYPIINYDGIMDSYNLGGWPSYFHICPDKKLSRTHDPGFVQIEYFLGSCEETVGMQETAITNFTSYPNPVSGEWHVQFERNHPLPVRISVVNMMGERISNLSQQIFASERVNHIIDFTGLPEGMYIIDFVSGDDVMTQKVVLSK